MIKLHTLRPGKIKHLAIFVFLFLPVISLYSDNTSTSILRNNILTTDGAWCWFAEPHAVFYKGIKEQTYFAWVTKSGDIEIAAFNHKTGVFTRTTLYSKLEEDDHDVPTIYFREDGRLVVFFSKHTTGPFHRFISQFPEDISSWSSDYTFGKDVTYPNPFKIGNQLALLYRGLNWHPTIILSNDNGETFGAAQQLIQGGGARPYAKYCQDKNGAIHIAFTDAHPRDLTTKIYYVCFKNNKFYRANGSFIKDFTGSSSALNIDTHEAEEVYDAVNGKGWIWDIAVDSTGNPVMVYSSFPSASNTDHRYNYARWNGSTWVKTELTKSGKWFPQTPVGKTEPEPNYSGGITLDYDNPSIVYLSKQVNGVFEIWKWTTKNHGATWDSLEVTSHSPTDIVNVRPIVPRHHVSGYFDVLWMKGKYIHYTNFDTSVLFRSDSVFMHTATKL